MVQVVLDQSQAILRAERGVLICRTHHGFVCANAGVDASNAVNGTVIGYPPTPTPRRVVCVRACKRSLGLTSPC